MVAWLTLMEYGVRVANAYDYTVCFMGDICSIWAFACVYMVYVFLMFVAWSASMKFVAWSCMKHKVIGVKYTYMGILGCIIDISCNLEI